MPVILSPHHQLVAEQAADWLLRWHSGDLTIDERRMYLAWLMGSQVHVAETLRMCRLYAYLESSAVDLRFRELQIGEHQTLLQTAIFTPVANTPDGVLIEAVSLPWRELISVLERDPTLIHQLHWRKWEEIVAAAYERQGYEVILTPHSKDRGRDVIAVHRRIGTIRIFDQVKAYAPGHLVTADDVRSMLGVLTAEPNVSKGFITTTSNFAPGIYKDRGLTALMPYRLELRPRDKLISWLASVKNGLSPILSPSGRSFTESNRRSARDTSILRPRL